MAIITDTGLDSFRANRSYHVTSRALGNLQPFKSERQKAELLDRFGFHLNSAPTHNKWGRPYEKLIGKVRGLSFNVMDNHLHNVAHQHTVDGISQLMSRVLTRQARSYNSATGWRGKVFSPFNATPFEELIDPTQIKDMVAYVELNNPILQFETPFASFQVMTGNLRCDWLDPTYVLGVFGGADHYCDHMNRRGPAIVRRKLIEWGIDPKRYPYRPIEPSMILLGGARGELTADRREAIVTA
jgi:REP element-mobilizing transposase RayT